MAGEHMFRSWWLAAGMAGLIVGACGGGGGSRSYPLDLPDDGYDLEAMQLIDADMPERGLQLLVMDSFDNVEWAQVFSQRRPEIEASQKEIQLGAQGRVRGYLSVFTWDEPVEHLGRVQQIESHSVLYSDEDSASRAMRQSACGLLIGDDKLLDEFSVPVIANEATGFFNEETLDILGKSIDTVVCFRTGRVLHAIVQNGLDGTQDIDVSVALAKRMLVYIDAAFDGEPRPGAEATTAEG
jgi:hypothetical protein